MVLDRLPAREKVKKRLDQLGIRQHEALGQHFLVNDQVISTLASHVNPGGKVIEVGSGVGQVTEAIAERAGFVTSIEIDRRYAPVLDRIAEERPNIHFVYQDALTFPWEKHTPKAKPGESDLQIVANLPYHISEPFIRKLALLNADNAVLLLGKKMIDEISAQTPESVNFGTLTLLAQAFFGVEYLEHLGRNDFVPPPRTESGLVKLTPRDTRFDPLSRRDFVFKSLFLSEKKNPSLASVLKDALLEYESGSKKKTIGKREHNRESRRQTRLNLRQAAYEYSVKEDTSYADDKLVKGQQRMIDTMRDKGITEAMLHKPFRLLDNTEIKKLASALT